MATSITCHCIATRPGGKYHDASEILSSEIVDSLDTCPHVYLFTDVVATGSTCADVAKRIKTADPQVRITVGCLIADKDIDRSDLFSEIDEMIVGCSSLRMPILEGTSVPDSNYIPSKYLFTVACP